MKTDELTNAEDPASNRNNMTLNAHKWQTLLELGISINKFKAI